MDSITDIVAAFAAGLLADPAFAKLFDGATDGDIGASASIAASLAASMAARLADYTDLTDLPSDSTADIVAASVAGLLANPAFAELIDDLTLTYNKVRQSNITREMIEIATRASST